MVADGHDRLRRGLAVQPARADPVRREARVDLPQARQVRGQQLLGSQVQQRVAGREVVGDVEKAPAAVALAIDEVRVLDEADERHLGVGDVRPVERRELPVELEQEAERRVVLRRPQPAEVGVADRRAQVVVEELLEDVAGDRRDDGVVALGAALRVIGARVVALAKRAGRAGAHEQPAVARAAQVRRRTVDQHAPAGGDDRVAQRMEEQLPGVRRVAELLVARLVALELAAQRELAPQPGHRDVLGARAELPAQQRAPDLAPRPAAHVALDPLACGDRLKRADLAGALLQQQHGDPHPQPRRRRQRLEAQEIQRPVERPLAPVEEERHRRRLPFQLVKRWW